MEIRTRYREELSLLMKKLIKMGVLAEEAVSKALLAVEENNTELADEVIENESVFNEMQKDIQDLCIRIIATEQPVAHDLREIITTSTIVSHLARIGRHGSYLAKAAKEVPEEIMDPVFPKIKRMAEIGISMLRESLDAFADGDSEKARKSVEKDKIIDEIHKELYVNIIRMMKENPNSIEYGPTLLFLNRFMERMGDHITNICDWVCYASTGKRLRD